MSHLLIYPSVSWEACLLTWELGTVPWYMGEL